MDKMEKKKDARKEPNDLQELCTFSTKVNQKCAFRFLAAQVFRDLGDLGIPFESLLGLDGLDSMFLLGLFPGHFCIDFLMESLTVGALKTRFS